MKGETDMVTLYNTKYNEALALAKRLGDGMERQDAYRLVNIDRQSHDHSSDRNNQLQGGTASGGSQLWPDHARTLSRLRCTQPRQH
jgi:hypothetical protein